MLPSSKDILPVEAYDNIKTLNLVVGTNVMDINDSSQTIPLLEVINDYHELIPELRQIFPNARIGLFNIMKLFIYLIQLLNDFFSNHVIDSIPSVF